jgi:GTPase KRas protein
MAHTQTYDPTIEDAYRKHLVVDNKMCFIEVIDTAGQGTPIGVSIDIISCSADDYAPLQDQWVR